MKKKTPFGEMNVWNKNCLKNRLAQADQAHRINL